LVLSKAELSLSNRTGFDVHNVIVLGDSKFLVFVFLSLVTDAYQHKEVSCSFPHCVQGTLHVGHIIRESDLLLDSVGFVSNDFTYFVFSQIVRSEIPFLIMSGFKPSYHRVMVGLLDDILISPFFVF